MDNLSEWGHGELKAWASQASFVGLKAQGAQTEEACTAEDLTRRMQVQNKLAGVCVDMCKEVGAYPKCTCPDFAPPDSTPGVMTWPELLEHMDNLSEWGHGELKAWTQQASLIQTGRKDDDDDVSVADLEDLDEDDARVVTGESVSTDGEDQTEIDADVEGGEQDEETAEDAEEEDAVESDSSEDE